MNRIVSALLLVAVAFTGTAAPLPKDAAVQNFFPLTKGSVWEYKTGVFDDSTEFTITVSEVEKKDGKFHARLTYQFGEEKTDEWVASDAQGVYRPGADGKWDKPTVVLKYPLKKGATWDSKLPTGDGGGPDAKAVVKETAEVEVPAGKFTATSVEFSGKENPNGPTTTLTAWYAPGVGVVKQVSFQGKGKDPSTIELKKFTPGK